MVKGSSRSTKLQCWLQRVLRGHSRLIESFRGRLTDPEGGPSWPAITPPHRLRPEASCGDRMPGSRRCFLTGMAVLATISALLIAQEEGTRGVTPEEFLKARPGKSAGKKSSQTNYKLVTPPLKGGTVAVRQMGITIWRLRPTGNSDGGPRILVQEGADTVSWTPERVASGAPLRMGDRVRLSIESPRAGYLYVIDREQYRSGAMGEAYLIFPTTRTNSGDNKVSGGKLVEVPAQDDRPNYFTLRQSRSDQSGEVLTVMVTERPLDGITVGPEALPLSRDQVAQWERDWSRKAERFELTGGAGRTWTKVEQEAGHDGTRRLTQDDPGPQTIYRVASGDAPFLTKVELKYRTGAVEKSTAAK